MSAGGIGLAGALGYLVSRAAVAPVERLRRAAEQVATTRDLSRRIEAAGSDELAALARSFNLMLNALESSLDAQRQLVADASHELRTPLASLRTNIEVLSRSDLIGDGERRALLVDVIDQLEELTELVGDLVELARDAEHEQEPAELVRLDLVVADAIERRRLTAGGVEFELDSEPSPVLAVERRLERAVSNLLDNAVKWSPPGGRVEVRVADGELSVRDHGPGIAPEDLPHIFDRFYRSAAARGLPGSGLGLAIVRQVAETQGGSVSVANADGGGAVFMLRLPPVAGRGDGPRLSAARAQRVGKPIVIPTIASAEPAIAAIPASVSAGSESSATAKPPTASAVPEGDEPPPAAARAAALGLGQPRSGDQHPEAGDPRAGRQQAGHHDRRGGSGEDQRQLEGAQRHRRADLDVEDDFADPVEGLDLELQRAVLADAVGDGEDQQRALVGPGRRGRVGDRELALGGHVGADLERVGALALGELELLVEGVDDRVVGRRRPRLARSRSRSP